MGTYFARAAFRLLGIWVKVRKSSTEVRKSTYDHISSITAYCSVDFCYYYELWIFYAWDERDVGAERPSSTKYTHYVPHCDWDNRLSN